MKPYKRDSHTRQARHYINARYTIGTSRITVGGEFPLESIWRSIWEILILISTPFPWVWEFVYPRQPYRRTSNCISYIYLFIFSFVILSMQWFPTWGPQRCIRGPRILLRLIWGNYSRNTVFMYTNNNYIYFIDVLYDYRSQFLDQICLEIFLRKIVMVRVAQAVPPQTFLNDNFH